jgi:hypothetical protein
MNDSTKEKSEKAKALRRLMRKWLNTQDTQRKADMLLARNPDLKVKGASRVQKES